MHKLEYRLRRLEVKHGACNHHPPHGLAIILNNPTDEEIQQKEKELAECPSCRRNGRPEIYGKLKRNGKGAPGFGSAAC